MKITLRYKGGKGSGDFGHAGRPGEVGGSAGGTGGGGTARVPEVSTQRKLEILDHPAAKRLLARRNEYFPGAGKGKVIAVNKQPFGNLDSGVLGTIEDGDRGLQLYRVSGLDDDTGGPIDSYIYVTSYGRRFEDNPPRLENYAE